MPLHNTTLHHTTRTALGHLLLGVLAELCYLSQALHRRIPKHGDWEKLQDKEDKNNQSGSQSVSQSVSQSQGVTLVRVLCSITHHPPKMKSHTTPPPRIKTTEDQFNAWSSS